MFWNFTVTGYFGEKAVSFGPAKSKFIWQLEGVWWRKLCKICYKFASTAITKYHKLSGLNNKNVLSHNSGGLKFKRGSAALAPSEGFEGEAVICCSSWVWWFARHPGTSHLCLHVPWPSPFVLALSGLRNGIIPAISVNKGCHSHQQL